MKKILIIEDDKDLLENIETFLQEEGFEPVTALDGSNGIHKALLALPDLIICDIALPDIDGFEVFKTLKQINVTTMVPFIFLTAKTAREEIRMGMQMGADDYITKPFTFSELSQSIKARLEKQEKIIHTSDEKFYTLVNNSFSGTFLLNNMNFEFVNNTLLKMTGYDDNEIKKMIFTDLVLNSDKKHVEEKITKALMMQYSSMQFTFYLLTKDKERVPVECIGGIIRPKGKNLFLGSIISQLAYNPNKNKLIIKKENKDLVKLTKRELEIIHAISQGLANTAIAKQLNISPRTVDKHRANILLKTESKNTADLMIFAVKNKIINV